MKGTRRLCIVRRGHMGDVVLTEPIASALRPHYASVALCTEYVEAGRLLEIYDDVLPYSRRLERDLDDFQETIELIYEIFPGCNHLDGYARFAGVEPRHRLPRVRRGAKRLIAGPYGLVAPDTSSFVQRMRQWPRERFLELREELQDALGMPFVLLEPHHSFSEMVALCEHSSCFVGNDSGPAILSQCFGRPTFVIFGATSPGLVLLDPGAVPIVSDVGCNGCKHFARHTDIECNTPLCLESLTVEMARNSIVVAGRDLASRLRESI